MLENKETPDVICKQLKFCTKEQCHAYPIPPNASTKYKYSIRMLNGDDPWWKPLLDEIMLPIKKMMEKQLPVSDPDKDAYSDIFSMRGSAWRGKDCNIFDANIYPGRRFRVGIDDPNIDNNCNGIYGVDRATNKSYEELLCSNIPRKGIAVLGDSASAHFRIPEQLIMKSGINIKNYKHILEIIQNEADWPQLSSITGYLINDTIGLTPGPVDSIYKRMKQRNRCIHRDYQNISVNGANSNNQQKYVYSLRRNPYADEPLLLFFSLIGNDVCGRQQSFDHFTTPQQFYERVVSILDYLDSILPQNSTIVFVGLAQGDLLYEFLKHEIHPLGITYEALYDWLNCLEQSPCWGWMNSNSTIRNITTNIAHQLSKVYDKIISEKQYKSFNMLYHDFPLNSIVQDYIKSGGKPKDLVEPFDGFHPSQIGQSLIAKGLYEWLEKEHSDVLGPINPHNELIEKLFGEQGGY